MYMLIVKGSMVIMNIDEPVHVIFCTNFNHTGTVLLWSAHSVKIALPTT